MAETFHNQNLDEVVVLNSDGIVATESFCVALGSVRSKAFFRGVYSYVERQRTALVSHFSKTPKIISEIKKLEDYGVVLCGKQVILKRDLFSGRLRSLSTTLLSSPVLNIFQLKDAVFESVTSCVPTANLNTNLEALYDYLHGLHLSRLITIKGFYDILAELPDGINARLGSAKDDCPSSSQKIMCQIVEHFIQNKKYDLALLKLKEFSQNVLLTDYCHDLHRFVDRSAEDQIQKIINEDAQIIEEFRIYVRAVKDSYTTDMDVHATKVTRRLRPIKRAEIDTPATSMAEQKRQLSLKSGVERRKALARELRRPTNPVAYQCDVAGKSCRLNRVCRLFGLDRAHTRKILELDYENMDASALDHVLKNQVGLDDHHARLILEVVKSPEEIDALVKLQENRCVGQKSSAKISCAQEHHFCEQNEQKVVTVFLDEPLAPLVVEESMASLRKFEVDVPPSAFSEEVAPADEALYGLETLTETLIKEIAKAHPGEIDAYTSIVREHIGCIPLTLRQVYNVMRGHKPTIDHILMCCQVWAAGFREKIEPQQASAPVLPVIDVDALETGCTTQVFGDVTLRMRAGIQASNNNCGLAAFFMSISNNGLLDQLIKDAEDRLGVVRSLDDSQTYPLKCLIDLLKHFNLRSNLDKFISNAGLDDVRLRYRLRVAKVKSDVIADAQVKKNKTVTLTVAADFHRGLDLNANNQSASITFDFLEHDAELRAVIRKLPEKSLGCMMIRGIALKIDECYAIADLQEIEFVPLGEILEPIEFIPPILNEIYDFNTSNPEQLASFSIWQESTTSFKQKVSIVEVQSDCQTQWTLSLPSNQFSRTIKSESIPAGFIFDPQRTFCNPHPFMEGIVGSVVEHYVQNGVLRLKLTIDLHHSSQHETRKTYEFYDENGRFERKVICELERYFANESVTFIRAKEKEFIDEKGERKRVELRMFGYSADRPYDGDMKSKFMHRARNFQELLNIFIESWKDRFANSEEAERARLALLPDEQHSPEVIFMTIPNEGKDQRCDFDWQTGVDLPMAGSEQRISYDVSAVMSIRDNHYLSWLRQPEDGLIHCADSMGDAHPELGPVPVVVTLPAQDGAAKLSKASSLSGGTDGYLFASVREKLLSLGQQVALVILKKKS